MTTHRPKGPTLAVRNLGQIREGEVTFGDLTLLIGGQASGKSIFLQLLKLLIDRRQVLDNLESHGYNVSKPEQVLELFFGEGMAGLWKNGETMISWAGKGFSTLESLVGKKGTKAGEENLFYIPAQRVVTMAQGWPRPFHSFDIGDPYVLKAFSETLRQLMERENTRGDSPADIFPRQGRIKEPIRGVIERSIFYGAAVELDQTRLRKRFVLRLSEERLPFMTWSAGQKEFMPLLLSLYHLTPPAKISTRGAIEWVVMEEPEMGLHPEAIQTVMLLCLELLHRGYRVAITTHSPVLLELVWVLNRMQEARAKPEALFDLFKLDRKPPLKEVFQTCLQSKVFKTFYFCREEDGIHIKDISKLDPSSEDSAEAYWGGLSEFASRAAAAVAKLPVK